MKDWEVVALIHHFKDWRYLGSMRSEYCDGLLKSTMCVGGSVKVVVVKEGWDGLAM